MMNILLNSFHFSMHHGLTWRFQRLLAMLAMFWTAPALSVLGPEEGTCKKKCYIQYNGTLVTKTCISMMDECNATLALLLFSLKMDIIFFMAAEQSLQFFMCPRDMIDVWIITSSQTPINLIFTDPSTFPLTEASPLNWPIGYNCVRMGLLFKL